MIWHWHRTLICKKSMQGLRKKALETSLDIKIVFCCEINHKNPKQKNFAFFYLYLIQMPLISKMRFLVTLLVVGLRCYCKITVLPNCSISTINNEVSDEFLNCFSKDGDLSSGSTSIVYILSSLQQSHCKYKVKEQIISS